MAVKGIENYLTVAGQLEETEQAIAGIDESLTVITDSLPDLVGAYSYANDGLYSVLYKISTLYQNLANYYYSSNGGDAFDYAAFGDWYDVIIFSNVVQEVDGV